MYKTLFRLFAVVAYFFRNTLAERWLTLSTLTGTKARIKCRIAPCCTLFLFLAPSYAYAIEDGTYYLNASFSAAGTTVTVSGSLTVANISGAPTIASHAISMSANGRTVSMIPGAIDSSYFRFKTSTEGAGIINYVINGTSNNIDGIWFSTSTTSSNGGLGFCNPWSSCPNVVPVFTPTTISLQTTPDAKPVDVSSDAVRQLASQIASTQRLVREGRNRFIQSRRQMRGDNAGISSRNMVDFEFDGTLNAKNGRISSKGSFFQQDGNFEGTSRRVFFGDFDIQRSGDTGSTTATLSGKMAWEYMLSEQNMVGYYIGADMARSNIKGTYFGEQNTYGVSVGTYFVSALQENLFLDGFASLGVGKNDLALANGTVDLSGDYNSRTVTLGAALTGVIKQEGYEIWPELAFTYGKTRLGTLSMTDSLAAVADNNVTLDAGDVSVANLTLRPEFRLPMDGLASVDSISLFTFAPRLLCEQLDTNVKTKNCGGGAEFGIDRTSEDGLSRFVARIKADRIAKVTRSALELKVEYRF